MHSSVRNYVCRSLVLFILCMVMFVSFFQPIATHALPKAQRDVFDSKIDYFDVATSCEVDASGQASLSGSGNEAKSWNFFKGKGLSDEQTAGIMGNLMQESHFDPQIMEIGGRSKDPNDAGGGGWGIIQWTPGSKVIGQAKEAGITGPIYELSSQLELTWQHMNNHPVVTQVFDLDHFKTLTNEVTAAEYFGEKIEGFGIAGDRWQDATDLLNKYRGVGGGSASAGGDNGGCAPSNASSPECATATGNAKILCEAKKYDPVSYVWGGGHAGGAAYHSACSTINDSKECGLDCSGLISVSIYDAFGGSGTLAWTSDLGADPTNWKEIPFNEIQAGDILQPNLGHVEIVDHVAGSTIHVFGAHSKNHPQPKQVGPTTIEKNDALKYYRYIGAGSS